MSLFHKSSVFDPFSEYKRIQTISPRVCRPQKKKNYSFLSRNFQRLKQGQHISHRVHPSPHLETRHSLQGKFIWPASVLLSLCHPLCVCHVHTLCLCQKYRVEGRRGQRGYGRSQNFGHCPREFSLNSFNPKKIEFGPPRLLNLNKKGKKIVLTGRHFSLTDYKASMFYTTHTHPKYQKYLFFPPHRFSSYQRVCTTHRQETLKPQSPLLHRTSQRWGVVPSHVQAKKWMIA